MKDSEVGLSADRVLAYTDVGEPDGFCFLFFHGAPMSRLHLAYLEDRFLAERMRVVSPDRPSYGGSSPQPGRSMTDWPSDVAALADALGIDRFVVAGHSSGGPYAVAFAALLAERVLGGIILGGVTDMEWPGAWEDYVDSESQLMRLPDEESAIAWCVERFGADGSGFLTATDFEFAEPDNALFADEKAGSALIPLAHSRHTSELVPGSTLRVLPGHGHLTTVSELPGWRLLSGVRRHEMRLP